MNSLPLISPCYCPHFKDKDPQRFREVKSPAQGHTASEWKNQFPRFQMFNSQISACMLSCFSSVQLFVTPWTVSCQADVACQAHLSMRFSRQECWSGLPFPSPGYLSDPGIKPASLMSPALAGGFFTTSTTWEVLEHTSSSIKCHSLQGRCSHSTGLICKPVLDSILQK